MFPDTLVHEKIARYAGLQRGSALVQTAVALRSGTTLRGRDVWVRHYCVSAALVVVRPRSRTRPRDGPSAGRRAHPAVAQIFNLLYRRIAFCESFETLTALAKSHDQPSATRRYSRVQLCATTVSSCFSRTSTRTRTRTKKGRGSR